ncbi:kinase-like domain-containing protein [Mycena floridula]|nr:kinase-like domain-containing protein [Mycena floridula]
MSTNFCRDPTAVGDPFSVRKPQHSTASPAREPPSSSAPPECHIASDTKDLALVTSARLQLAGYEDLTSLVAIPGPIFFPVAWGGYADIYKGCYRPGKGEMESVVALKVFRITSNCDVQRALKRLKREAAVWKRIRHSNIAEYHGLCVIADRPSLVLTWYNNGSAREYLKGKDFDTRLFIVKDIVKAIQYLHGQNIVHGDIKGDNALITDSGRAVVTDFGLARVLQDLLPTGFSTSSFAGSIPWQAPELFSGGQRKTLASDVWALGCTVYELLTGRMPYSHLRQPFAIGDCIRAGGIPLLPSDEVIQSCPVIRDLLLPCWAMTPSDRVAMEAFGPRLFSV